MTDGGAVAESDQDDLPQLETANINHRHEEERNYTNDTVFLSALRGELL